MLLALALCEFVRTGFYVAYLPNLSTKSGMALIGVGVLASSHYVLDALTKAPMAFVADRIGTGRLILLGFLIGLLAMFLIPQVPYVVALLLSALWGLTTAALWPSVLTLVSLKSIEGQENHALNLANVAVAPGVALGMLGVGQVMQVRPEWVVPLLEGAGFLGLLITLFLWKLRVHVPAQKLNVQQFNPILILIPAAFLQTMIPSLFGTVLYPLLSKVGLTLVQLVPVVVVTLLLGLISMRVAGGSTLRVPPRTFTLLGLLGMFAAFVMLTLVPLKPPISWLVYTSMALLGAGYGAFLSGWNGMVVRTLPVDHRSTVWGTLMMIEAFGFSLGPALGGAFWDLYGTRGPFVVASILILLVLLYYGVQVFWKGKNG